MRAGRNAPLYLLAFDHRASFKSDLLGIHGDPSVEEHRRVSDLKALVYEGFGEAVAEGVPKASAGVLVDEEFGVDVARAAKAAGAVLVMSVERSGQAEFEPEYGRDFGSHIESFDPDLAKVLVRYNPEGDTALNARQAERLAGLSAWLAERGRRFLFELLVPPTPAQSEAAGGSLAYEHRFLAELTVRAIAELQAAGVSPAIWKMQGFEEPADYERVVAQAQTGGRHEVLCIVLGHGQDAARVQRWLRRAAGVAGYDGFAIGRTIWWEPLADYLARRADRRQARVRITAAYIEMVKVYETAKADPGAQGGFGGKHDAGLREQPRKEPK